jgi:hypothetical protein
VICTYHVKPRAEARLLRLLLRHDATLRRLRLVTARAAQTFRRRDDQGRVTVVDIFEWRGADAVERAHRDPAVHELWNAVTDMVEERDGRPAMEFPHYETVVRPAARTARRARRGAGLH